MLLELSDILAKANSYTGYEHTRILNLIMFLAYLSIAMWGVVIVSMLIRLSARNLLIKKRVGPEGELKQEKKQG